MSTQTDSPASLASLRIVMAAGLSAIVVLGVGMWLSVDSTIADNKLLYAIPIVLGIAAAAACNAFGYRTAAIEPGTPPDEAGRTSATEFQRTLFVRFSLSESVVIASVMLTYGFADVGFAMSAVGAVVGLILTAYFAWPGERNIAKTQASLEREGGTSYLLEGLKAR